MIVGFSRHGTGGGRGPVNYLTANRNPDRTARIPPPAVLRGNPELTRMLIDSLAFKHKYTSGVLSFAPGEHITEAMEARIMDGFEQVAFAGLERDQYSILWVRHTHAGHHELHFLAPRVELATGKSLNIAPPGRATRELYDTYRSLINAEYALADPEDPARSRAVSLPDHLAKLQAHAQRQGKALKEDKREIITAFIQREIDAGRISDRAGVETYLQGQGFTLTRSGKDYITILEPGTGERLRLKGSIYSREPWNQTQAQRYGTPDPVRAAELATKLEQLAAARAAYHYQRYGQPEHEVSLPDLQSHELHAATTRRRLHRQQMQQAAMAIEQGMEFQ
jgi:relaxase-like protein